MKPDILEMKPQELRFVFELKKQCSCSVQMINKTNHHVAFKIKATDPTKYCVRPNAGVVDPNSVCDFTVTMQAQMVAPTDLVCRDKFLVQSTFVPEGTKEEDVTSHTFSKGDGKTVVDKRLKVVLIPASESPESLPINETVQKNDGRELKDDVVQKHSSHAKIDEGLEVSKGEGESVEATRKEEIIKRKDEDEKWKEDVKRKDEGVKKNEESAKRSKEVIERNDEPMQMNDAEELRLVKNLEETKSKVKELESKLSEVDERMEVSKGEGESVEATRKEEIIKKKDEDVKRKEETVKRKDEDVKRNEESAKRSKEVIKTNNEPLQMNDAEELRLLKELEETKSKVKELEAKLSEAKETILHLSEEKRSAIEERHFLQGELDLMRSKRYKAQVGFPLLFVFMVGLVRLVRHNYRNIV